MSEPQLPPSSLLRRLSRKALSMVLTLSVVAGAGLAVFAGAQLLSDRAEAALVLDPAPAVPVSVAILEAAPGYGLTRRFVGQVEARSEAALSFELAGKVTEITVEEGAAVAAGAVLARLDTTLLEAEKARLGAARDALAADRALAQSRLKRAQSLRETGFASQDALDAAAAQEAALTARLAEIDASLAGVEARLEKSVLRAPFSGRVGQRPADPGVTVAAGQPVLSLVEEGPQLVRVGVPVALERTALEQVTFTLSGGVAPARLARMRPDVDPVTRTRTAVFALEGGTRALAGETATLEVESFVETPGVWLPLDALGEAAGGGWQVMVADAGVARTARVEVLHAEGARAFVRGSFAPDAALIVAGAHRLVPGQAVVIRGTEG